MSIFGLSVVVKIIFPKDYLDYYRTSHDHLLSFYDKCVIDFDLVKKLTDSYLMFVTEQ